jgi:hypothetical protein
LWENLQRAYNGVENSRRRNTATDGLVDAVPGKAGDVARKLNGLLFYSLTRAATLIRPTPVIVA